MRLGINIGNILSFMNSKIVLFTSADSSRQSATICYNLGAYYARTSRKVLIVEADMTNNYLCKLTGASTQGGLNEVMSAGLEVNIKPFTVESGLDVLCGDPEILPAIYRLASENFLELLNELKKNYDYIFIHARPTLNSPEAADLSRYAGITVVNADARQANIGNIDNIVTEMKLFLSKYTYFVVENAEDGFVKTTKLRNNISHISKAKNKPMPPEVRKAS